MAYLMIVDDDEDFAAAAAKALQKSGHEVRVELETAGAVKSMLERRVTPQSWALGGGVAKRRR